MEKILLVTCFSLFALTLILMFELKDKTDNLKYLKNNNENLHSKIIDFKWQLKYNFKTMSKKEFKKYFKDLFGK